jgi:hypothetical protein
MPATMLMIMLMMVAIVFIAGSIGTIRPDCNHATQIDRLKLQQRPGNASLSRFQCDNLIVG